MLDDISSVLQKLLFQSGYVSNVEMLRQWQSKYFII